MHLLVREIPQNYHTFALFDPQKMDNLINMEPENHLFEKENHLPNLQFGFHVTFLHLMTLGG